MVCTLMIAAPLLVWRTIILKINRAVTDMFQCKSEISTTSTGDQKIQMIAATVGVFLKWKKLNALCLFQFAPRQLFQTCWVATQFAITQHTIFLMFSLVKIVVLKTCKITQFGLHSPFSTMIWDNPAHYCLARTISIALIVNITFVIMKITIRSKEASK